METQEILADTLRDLDDVREGVTGLVNGVEEEHYHRLGAMAFVVLETVTEAQRNIQGRLDSLKE